MTSKNIRALVIGVIISVVALYFALRNVDFSTLWDSVISANPAWMALVLASYAVHYWLKAIRWRDLLEPVKCVTTGQAYPVMMSGFFANNILPAHLGELVRMYVGSKLFLVSKTQVLATIMLERILDFSTIAVLFGGALVLGSAISDQLALAGYVLLGLTLFAWLVIFIALRFEQPMLRFTGWLLKPLPDRFAERMLEMLVLALSALHSMKSLRLVIRSVVLSLLQWGLVGLAVFAALQSVGVDIGMAVALITLAATVLAVALPAAPGFFGTIQLAFVLALVPYGVTESDALAGSVIFHIISYGYVMISGVIVLNQLNMRVSDLNRGVDQD
jgi:uncharacterized protein (TIRG00374 family)